MAWSTAVQLSAWRANVDMQFIANSHCRTTRLRDVSHPVTTFNVQCISWLHCTKLGWFKSSWRTQDGRVSILDPRPSTPIYNTLTNLEYAQQYTMPKELGAQPNKRRKNVVVITRPYYPPDPAGPKYEQYCQQSLMKHKSFRQVSDLPWHVHGSLCWVPTSWRSPLK